MLYLREVNTHILKYIVSPLCRIYEKRPVVSFIITAILAWFFIAIRSPSVFKLQKIMFMEDIPIFFEQANVYGIHSIFMPYVGYNHLLLRTVALVASFLKNQYIPVIYFFAVIAVFSFTVILLFKTLSFLPVMQRFLIAFSVLVLPSGRSLYDNLTYSQWTAAIALSVFMLSPWKAYSGLKLFFINFGLFFLCLQGPFSIFLFPFVILKIFTKELPIRKHSFVILITYITSMSLQLFTMFTNRPPAQTYNIQNIFALFVLGPFTEIYRINFLSCIVVLYILELLISYIRNNKLNNFKSLLCNTPLFLVIGLFLFSFEILLSSIAKHGRYLHDGYQYAHNFYFAIVTSFIVLSKTKWQKIFSIILFIPMLFNIVRGLELTNSYWDSHIAFKRKNEHVQLRNGWFHWNLKKSERQIYSDVFSITVNTENWEVDSYNIPLGGGI